MRDPVESLPVFCLYVKICAGPPRLKEFLQNWHTRQAVCVCVCVCVYACVWGGREGGVDHMTSVFFPGCWPCVVRPCLRSPCSHADQLCDRSAPANACPARMGSISGTAEFPPPSGKWCTHRRLCLRRCGAPTDPHAMSWGPSQLTPRPSGRQLCAWQQLTHHLQSRTQMLCSV